MSFRKLLRSISSWARSIGFRIGFSIANGCNKQQAAIKRNSHVVEIEFLSEWVCRNCLIQGVILLKQLTYASRAIQNLNSDDLSSIVASSVRNNALYGLTGALCYANGTFIQYFEGDHLAVNRLYRHLLKDVRHSDLTVVSVYEVAKRRFPTWSMGFFSYESEIGQIFLKHSKMAKVSPFSMIASDANEFFNEVVKYVSTE